MIFMTNPTYYSGESFDIAASFTDTTGTAATPESLNYTIKNSATGEVVRYATPSITSNTYTIPVTITDNTITGESEERRVVINWTYNGGTKGDIEVYNYRLVQP